MEHAKLSNDDLDESLDLVGTGLKYSHPDTRMRIAVQMAKERLQNISATRRSATAFDRRYWFGKVWPRWTWTAEKLNWNARYRQWIKQIPEGYIFATRKEMYVAVCPRGPITYLEFGVAQGESLLQWLSLNKHEDSRFHGFDAWEGMPGEEGSPFNKGSFEGEPPSIGDARCTLHKGWFTDTLPDLLNDELLPRPGIINLDADEYGPTLYVLTQLDPAPGTIIMLDEASVAHCEFRALLDWQRAYGRKVKPIAGWRHGKRIEGVAVEVRSLRSDQP